MNHAAAVGVGQGPRHLLHQLGGVRRLHRSGAAHPIAQGFAVDQRHDEIDEIVLFLDQVDRDDVGVRETGRGARLAQEALPRLRLGRKRWRQQLDGHRSVQCHIACQVHDAHAAAAEFSFERVSARQGTLELVEHFCRVRGLRAVRVTHRR